MCDFLRIIPAFAPFRVDQLHKRLSTRLLTHSQYFSCLDVQYSIFKTTNSNFSRLRVALGIGEDSITACWPIKVVPLLKDPYSLHLFFKCGASPSSIKLCAA
jgi:hypothetical protein